MIHDTNDDQNVLKVVAERHDLGSYINSGSCIKFFVDIPIMGLFL
jgi:hypothetical protein